MTDFNNLKFISEEFTINNISIQKVNELIFKSFKNQRHYLLPPKTHIPLPDNAFVNSMPCVIDNIFTCKIVMRTKNRESVTIELLLYDINTNQLKAIFNARWITSIRTGSAALIAVDQLAVKNFQNISLIGLGSTMTSFIKCFLDFYKNRKVNFFLKKYKDQANKIIELFKENKNITFTIIDNNEELFSKGDIIVSAVSFTNGLFTENLNCFKKGCLIIPIYSKGFQNCEDTFDKVITDDINLLQKYQNFSKMKNITELTDIINNIKVGRQNDEERILCYNIGLGIHDNIIASYIYNNLINST